jgi:hypothetical protein
MAHTLSPEELYEAFRRELEEQGLPEYSTLADLIRHHRGNAVAPLGFAIAGLELQLQAAKATRPASGPSV